MFNQFIHTVQRESFLPCLTRLDTRTTLQASTRVTVEETATESDHWDAPTFGLILSIVFVAHSFLAESYLRHRIRSTCYARRCLSNYAHHLCESPTCGAQNKTGSPPNVADYPHYAIMRLARSLVISVGWVSAVQVSPALARHDLGYRILYATVIIAYVLLSCQLLLGTSSFPQFLHVAQISQ